MTGRLINNKKDLCLKNTLFSYSAMSNSLQYHGLQHTRLPCPSPSPRACSNSCPLTQWTEFWVDSESWWWTGRPGMLRFMGSQSLDTTEQLNWTEHAKICLFRYKSRHGYIQLSHRLSPIYIHSTSRKYISIFPRVCIRKCHQWRG